MSKHSPGPWFTKREGFSTVYVEARISGGMLQDVAACGPTEAGSEQQEANARLISAAPELLDALKLCEGNISSLLASAHPKVFGVWLEVVRAAIAKATGDAA